MNIFRSELIFNNGVFTALSKSIVLKLIVLLIAFSLYTKPVPAKGFFLLALVLVAAVALVIVDNNSCWVNLIWGCDSNNGGGGGGQVQTADGTVVNTGTVSYESDFPPASDPNGLVPAGGTGGGTRDSIDSKPCTQGSTCPGDELGEPMVTKSTTVSPAYADSKTNTCPLFWVAGKEDAQSTVTCKLITGSKSVDLPRNAPINSTKNVFQIPVGKHVLSCSRTTTETVTQYGTKAGAAKTAINSQTNTFITTKDQNVRCNAIPNVNEI